MAKADKKDGVVPTKAPPPQIVESTELAPPARHTGRLYPVAGCAITQCPTNLDLDTNNGKALAIAASNPSDLEITDGRGLTAVFTHYLIFADQSVDEETGEVSEFPRTVLYTREGLTFRTSSEHMPHKIAQICDLFGEGGWGQGIRIRISERRSRKTGRTYHDLRIEPHEDNGDDN